MKNKALAVPGWLHDEWTLLRYLLAKHDGHPYGEELLEGISLMTSWALIALAIVSVLAVVGDALIR